MDAIKKSSIDKKTDLNRNLNKYGDRLTSLRTISQYLLQMRNAPEVLWVRKNIEDKYINTFLIWIRMPESLSHHENSYLCINFPKTCFKTQKLILKLFTKVEWKICSIQNIFFFQFALEKKNRNENLIMGCFQIGIKWNILVLNWLIFPGFFTSNLRRL